MKSVITKMLYLYNLKNTLKKHVIIKNGEKKEAKASIFKKGRDSLSHCTKINKVSELPRSELPQDSSSQRSRIFIIDS